jgi:hypothetical protein
MIRRLSAALAAALWAATAAAKPTDPQPQPRPGAPDCAAPLAAGAGPVSLTAPMSEADRLGLSAAVFVTLADSTGKGSWPEPQIDQAAPCPIGRFEADGVGWTLYGGKGEVPVRWARAAGRQDFVFLAWGPTFAQADEWRRQDWQGEMKLTHPLSYLVGATGGAHAVLKVYDGGPSQAELTADMAAALNGRLAPMAIYDPRGYAVTVMRPTRSGVRAQMFGPEGQSATLYGPDGRYFVGGGDEAVRMRGSGFRCPAAFGRLGRSRMIVVKTADDELDLACGFEAGGSWITLFVTRTGARLDAATFQGRLADAQREAGVSRKLPGQAALPFGEAWLDRDGAGQGLWMAQRGPYLVEARVTFQPTDEPVMREAVAEIARATAEIAEAP